MIPNTEALVKSRLSKGTEGFEQGFKFYIIIIIMKMVVTGPISGVSKTI